MTIFWQVDAFTDRMFQGNPAAVFPIASLKEDANFQKIAMEMNLSETVFVAKNEDGSWGIRWFTPNSEVNLCGHATLAAAHILFSKQLVSSNTIDFDSHRSGKLKATLSDNLIWLDFPIQEATAKSFSSSLNNQHNLLYSGSNGHDAVLVFDNETAVTSYQPDYAEIAKIAERGLIVTAKSSSDKLDYVYRAFFPKLGIPEDPVTGSANTLLAPYWAHVLDKPSLTGYQASNRGGALKLILDNDRVRIGGNAVTVFEGTMNQ